MGSRGLYGFIKDGVEKATYSHGDSYPSYLGRDIIDFIKKTTDTELVNIFDRIVLVDGDTKPSADELRILLNSGQYDDTQSGNSWNDVIRSSRKNFGLYKKVAEKGCPIYITDDKEFIYNSFYCEYVYFINLDTMRLEFWLGWQTKQPYKGNRYGETLNRGPRFASYPCRPAVEYPLALVRAVPTDDLVGIMNSLYAAEEKYRRTSIARD